MRFLKTKIAHARDIYLRRTEPKILEQLKQEESHTLTNDQKLTKPLVKRRRLPGYSFTPENVKITKNIVINFGRAISSFATSKLSLDYLEPLIVQEKVMLSGFTNFISTRKVAIGGISSLRSLLLITCQDSEEDAAYKRIFKALSEIFIKYFSVNWITHGRMGHKSVYLKYRFKMLRRVQNPETFTYLKGAKDSL